MSIYFYLIIWGCGGCLVGICIGFFFASILNSSKDDISLFEQNERLSAENIELVTKLWEIEALINKHFGVMK